MECTGPSIASLGIIPGPHVFDLTNSPSKIIIDLVPEPTTLALAGLALLGVACRRRRRA
ncbi:MAG: PEP-CTERM sorting domain-containing protein [Desulfobulbia bacterium]